MRTSRTYNARTRAVAIAIVAVFTSTVTACSSGSSDNTATKQPTKPATTDESTDTTDKTDASSEPSSSPTATGPTIQLGWCNGGSGVRAVQLLDPQTKDGEIRYFPVEALTYQSNADCNSNLEGRESASTFDKYFNRLGAQWVNKDDGTYRAGYIAYITSPEATNTTFTDLSGIGDGTSNGSFGTTVKQSKPYFGSDGMLNFVADTGNSYQLMTVHPSDGSTPAKSPDNQNVDGITPEDSTEYVYTLPNDDIIGDDKIMTEDGHWVSAGDGTISYGQGNEKGATTEPEYGHTLYPVWVNPKQPTEFIGWDNEKQIVRATIKGNKVTTTDVLGATDGTISEVTVDPTGTQAAFILKKVNDSNSTTSVELYTVSLKGDGINEPKLVKTLLQSSDTTVPISFRIYGWNTVPSER